MAGMNEEYILDEIYMLRNENPEYHEKIINILIDEYDETVTTSSSSCISIEENIICIHRIPETVNTVTISTSNRLCFSIKETILVCADEQS